ncbi:MAG: toxin-antitoxin system YwqK family antitoxin [Verrucomicrobiota bacterium]
MESELNIAEILYHNGGPIHFRYTRYLSPQGDKWIRHGLFRAYHVNGQLSSEGYYTHGFEEGIWRDYHENGQLAAEGAYEKGQKVGKWKYWNSNGENEPTR